MNNMTDTNKDKIIEELREELNWMTTQLNSSKAHTDRYKQMLKELGYDRSCSTCDRCEELWFEKDFYNEGGISDKSEYNMLCGVCITEMQSDEET